MNVLLTGSTGFVGQALTNYLNQEGFSVTAAVRRSPETFPPSVQQIPVADLLPETDWQPALSDVGTVVHLAARAHILRETAPDPLSAFRKVNVQGTKRLAEQAASSGVRRFIFISSIGVLGTHTNGRKPFTEEDKPTTPEYYGISKWEAEQSLRKIEAESGMEVAILRPPLIYGPGVKANFLNLVKLVDKGIPLPLDCVKNTRSLLGLSNMISAITTCITHEKAAGKTYLLSDGEDVSTPELVRHIATALGKKPRLLPIPTILLRLSGNLTGKTAQVDRLLGSLVIDSSKIRDELGWRPVCSMQEELEKMAGGMQK
ncbi:MAG: SDR family oxidoreductase [Candidatus Electrothrix sp. GM3_4]|nr:SDR family oxidoreductase [Candidatus Electrothrix sp. GM3_4]